MIANQGRIFMDIESFCDAWVENYSKLIGAPPKKLGCGNYGCAYELDARNILKITVQESEAKIAEQVLNTTLHEPFWPKIQKIQKFLISKDWQQAARKKTTSWFIWRESLDDLPCDDVVWMEDSLNTLDMEIDRLLSSKDLLSIEEDPDVIIDLALSIIEADAGTPEDELKFEQIAEILDVCIRKHHLWLADLSYENLGIRSDGTIVVRDLGGIRKMEER